MKRPQSKEPQKPIPTPTSQTSSSDIPSDLKIVQTPIVTATPKPRIHQLPFNWGTENGFILKPTETPLGIVLVKHRALQKPPSQIELTISPIPFADWQRIVSFLVWTQQTFGEEALIHGYYNNTSRTWKIEPPIQTPQPGLSVTCDDHADENRARDIQLQNEGYILRFTAHHHCNANAGQSGTDKEDEHSKPSGFHVTLGQLDKPKLDLHSRIVYTTPSVIGENNEILMPAETVQITNDDAILASFIDSPVNQLLAQFPGIDLNLAIFYKYKWTTPFPNEWKHALRQKKPAAVQQMFHGTPHSALSHHYAERLAQAPAPLVEHYVHWIFKTKEAKRKEVFQSNLPPETLDPDLLLRGFTETRPVFDAVYSFIAKCTNPNLVTADEMAAMLTNPMHKAGDFLRQCRTPQALNLRNMEITYQYTDY